ncbi:MAG: hypothetical protein DI629_12560 [Mesorhizobium amorphae]|nr:MAG: hypothetical protein DI629_12560 [Mesorhizobium amorphae]
MRRLLLLLLVSIVSTMPAAAVDTTALMRKVQSCWSLPPGAEGLAPVTVTAVIGEGGALDKVEVEGAPASAEAEALAASALRAIKRCAPYPELPPGAVRFTLDPTP